MSKGYSGEVIPQATKPESKVRMFHGSPNKITNGVIEARKVPYENMGMEDSAQEEPGGGIHIAFATSNIREAADYAGPKGHIYEVHEKPDHFDVNFSEYHHDILGSTGTPLTIKQEVGFPGENPARRMARGHFDMGHGESRK